MNFERAPRVPYLPLRLRQPTDRAADGKAEVAQMSSSGAGHERPLSAPFGQRERLFDRPAPAVGLDLLDVIGDVACEPRMNLVAGELELLISNNDRNARSLRGLPYLVRSVSNESRTG